MSDALMSNAVVKDLESHGIARLPPLVSEAALASMQAAFASRLNCLRWNDQDGYERTELYRHMVQDILTLDQGFVDVALHPSVLAALDGYLGDSYSLVEAKGWKSLVTSRNFHGWHGDAWYDQETVTDRIPREVKLGFYLTNVRSGAFQYLTGTHRTVAPKSYSAKEASDLPLDRLVEMTGPAGTAFLFDTSGIHRQAYPILEQRQAFFLNYHDPSIPLQREDLEYYRYHPLILNAAFLCNLSARDMRVLGFGVKTNYVPAYQRQREHARFQSLMGNTFSAQLAIRDFSQRVAGKLRRLVK